MNVSDVVRAEELVVRDQLAGQNDPDEPRYTYATALQHAVDTVALDDVEGDDELAEAYRVVLAYRVGPTRHQLLDLVELLAREGVPQLTTAQQVWAWRAERGELR